jgi:hypothetical protein
LKLGEFKKKLAEVKRTNLPFTDIVFPPMKESLINALYAN